MVALDGMRRQSDSVVVKVAIVRLVRRDMAVAGMAADAFDAAYVADMSEEVMGLARRHAHMAALADRAIHWVQLQAL